MSNVGRIVDADAAIRGFCEQKVIADADWQKMIALAAEQTNDWAKTFMAQPLQHQASQSMQLQLEQARKADQANDLPPSMGHANAVNQAMNVAAQQAMPYLAVPRVCETNEMEILRQQLAAAQRQIAALTPHEPAPLPNPMTRALSRWPGSVGFMQGLRWRGV